MPTTKQTISVRLNAAAKRQIEHAAHLSKQSSGAFLEKVGEERAKEVLLSWALARRKQDDVSFSELASETGLAVEELMLGAAETAPNDIAAAFLASCRAIAESSSDPEFLRMAEQAVKSMEFDLPGTP